MGLSEHGFANTDGHRDGTKYGLARTATRSFHSTRPFGNLLMRGDADGGKSPRATCRVSALLRFKRNRTRDLG